MKNALLASNFNRVSKKSYVGVNHGFITYELTDKMKRWVLVARFRGCYLPQITISLDCYMFYWLYANLDHKYVIVVF